jgi:hypothetical protein
VIVFGHRFVTDESKYSKVIRVDPILIKKENFRQETQHTLGRKYKKTHNMAMDKSRRKTCNRPYTAFKKKAILLTPSFWTSRL